MRPTEEQIIAKGNGLHSGWAVYGRYWIAKALQGATLWEMSEGQTGPRRFYDSFAEAADIAEAAPSRFEREWTIKAAPQF